MALGMAKMSPMMSVRGLERPAAARAPAAICIRPKARTKEARKNLAGPVYEHITGTAERLLDPAVYRTEVLGS